MHSTLVQYLNTPAYYCSRSSGNSLTVASKNKTECLMFEFNGLFTPDSIHVVHCLLQSEQPELPYADVEEYIWEKLSVLWALIPTSNLNKNATSMK